MKSHVLALLGLLLVTTSCTEEPEKPITIQARPLPNVQHGRSNLRWKRFRVLQKDLARALELPERAVCTERSGEQCAAGGIVTLKDWLRSQNVLEQDLDEECKKLQGTAVCTDGPYIPLDNPRGIHVIPLGGNNPFLSGILEQITEPIVTTPIALDRFVLSACGERVAKDVAGSPAVFKSIDLGAPITAASPGIDETIVDLYKRLLAREPTAAEKTAVLSVVDGPSMTGAEFARLSCFIVATLPEFVFQ
jgi:hypothetical protein